MERDNRFLPGVAAVLFLGLCAYAGAELGLIAGREYVTVTAERTTVTESVSLEGTALRQERVIRSSSEIIVQDGARVAAGARLTDGKGSEALRAECSCIYCADTDGYEYFEPAILADAPDWDLQSMERESTRGASGRLITSRDWYFAARVKSAGELPAGEECTLRFEGLEGFYPARIISREEGGRLLLRLPVSDRESLSLRFCSAELITASYTGLRLPKDAVLTGGDGTSYVYTLAAGKEKKTAVELIYTDREYSLAKIGGQADSLPEGAEVVCPAAAIERKDRS